MTRVLVSGGGIGGVCAALSLARQGMDVDVFEQAPGFGETGAGIQLSPNCNRVLDDLGLIPAIEAVVFLPEGGEFRHWKTGRVLSRSPLGAAVKNETGFAYYHVHRADLMSVLAAAAGNHPRINLHTESAVESVEQNDKAVKIRVNGQVHRGDLLIGADGIHSHVRTHLSGPESPVFTGTVAWRMLVPVERLPAGMVRPMSTVWWGPHRHFVHYYVRRGELVNCVCVVEKTGWETESWTEKGDHAELKSDFAGWHADIRTLIDNADKDNCYKWALYDRPPMKNWSRGRVTLLGDACHPTLPFMAQGAAMAIEDGAVLARCIATGADDIETSLARYESLRQARTAAIQKGSRRNARIFHMSGVQAWARNITLALRSRPAATRWLFDYDALHAHER